MGKPSATAPITADRLLKAIMVDFGARPKNGAYEVALKRVELFELSIRMDEAKSAHAATMAILEGKSQVPAVAGH